MAELGLDIEPQATFTLGRVHYVDEGLGTPVLFLHGNPTWSFLYRHLITALRDRFRCVAVDYPGFGLSERPDGYGYTPSEHAGVVGEVVDHASAEVAAAIRARFSRGILLTSCALEHLG